MLARNSGNLKKINIFATFQLLVIGVDKLIFLIKKERSNNSRIQFILMISLRYFRVKIFQDNTRYIYFL